MIKKKKIIITIIAIICSLSIIIATLFGINRCYKDRLDFTINDTLPEGYGKNAKVIILAGQSNAAGCSSEQYLEQNVSSEKFSEYKNGYDNVYINSYVTNRNETKGFIQTTTNLGEPGGHFGPEVGLAEKLHESNKDQLYFIIKFTWSASDLFNQWLSPSSKGKTGMLYKNFTRYVNQSIRYLKSKNYDVSIEGICWMQGESDAFTIENGTNYEIHLKNFIKDLRKEFDRFSSSDGIAFIDAYIAASPAYWVYYELVNESKRKVAESSSMNVVIDTNAHGLETHKEPIEQPDMAHYDSLSEIKLGHLFAQYLFEFL